MVSLHTETAKFKWVGHKNEFCFLRNTLGFSVLFEKQCKWVLLVLNIKRFDGYKSSWRNQKNLYEPKMGKQVLRVNLQKWFKRV